MPKRPMSRHAISALGGKARAKALSAAKRRNIARKAAKARWNPAATASGRAYVYTGPVAVALPAPTPEATQ